MLNDEQIEKLLYEYAKRQDEFSLSVIKIIADRINHLADFDSLDAFNTMLVMQKDQQEITDLLWQYRKDQKKRIERDWWWLIEYAYGEAILYYETQLALAENRELTSLVEDQIQEAQFSFSSLTDNPVITMRDLANPNVVKDYGLNEAYRSVVNEAMSYRNLSEDLARNALNRTETQLFNSGVRYLVDGESVSGNNAVRFNILDSMKRFINKAQEVMGRQFGADGMELSAHIYPAPDHAPAQGHQFTMENVDKMQSGSDFEDVDGNSYIGFERQIGQWNCRHYFMSIKIGKSEPTYTQEELDRILEENERGYTAPNGRHYTLYECTQIQRKYERNIRQAKEKYLFSKSLGNKTDMLNARNRVGSLTSQYKLFSNACGIPAKLERIKVKDY